MRPEIEVYVEKEKYHNNNILVIRIDGKDHSFSVQNFDKGAYGWLIEVMKDQVADIYNQGYREGRESIRKPFKEAFKLLDK